MTRFITIALVLVSSAATSAAWATPISDKYAQLGGAAGFLGQPTIAETWTPDGVGRFRHYEGGSIYWHPRTGAHEVHGLIRQRWAQLNWEQGYLGYPVTDEIDTVDGGGRVSRFEGGELIWTRIDQHGPRGEGERSGGRAAVPGRRDVEGHPEPTASRPNDSHFDKFAYCWDFKRAGAQANSNGKPFSAVANGRLVHVDDFYGSGDDNPGNVIVQRLGPSRYASYLHGKAGSYIDALRCGVALRAAGAAMELASVGFDRRGAGGDGRYRRQRGRLPSAFLRHDGARSPARYKPFESVPVSFRNYEKSDTLWHPLDGGGRTGCRAPVSGCGAGHARSCGHQLRRVTQRIRRADSRGEAGRTGPAGLQRRHHTHSHVGMGRGAEVANALHRQHLCGAVDCDDHRRAGVQRPEAGGHLLGRVERSDLRLDRGREQLLLVARGRDGNRDGEPQGAQLTRERLASSGAQPGVRGS